jgi:hypothetical protein
MGPPSSGRCPVLQVSTKFELESAGVIAGLAEGGASEAEAGAVVAEAVVAEAVVAEAVVAEAVVAEAVVAVTVEKITADRHRPTTAPRRHLRGCHPWSIVCGRRRSDPRNSIGSD